ncbi:MAG: TetR/AcrR family transcriptional regulator [Acetobacteraceae bacterium]|nr:TetR/AcrR family transcriptional regulator [Acetobacteraceae bacterium]
MILQSALATFLERGFEGTRMVDVATRAGLAKGTLYLHFADKEALFEFVLQEVLSAPMARLRTEVPGPDESVRSRLSRLFMPLLRDFETSGRASVLRLIIAEGARFPALAQIHRRLVIDPMMEAVALVLEGAPDRKRLEPLIRCPQLLGAPVIMASIWNELWSRGERVDAEAMMVGFLDLVFGPA